MATYTPGIDVSRYEGEIDWKQVASAGYKFAVMRATVGDYYTDPTFYTNWSGAKAAGLLVSAYHVLVATKYAETQIQRLFSILGTRKSDFPLILDVERYDNVSNAALTGCVQDCLREMMKRDARKPIIYTAHYFWNDHILPSSDWAKYDLWVASYDAKPFLPPGWTNWKFWQYSPNGIVPGVASSADLNHFQGSYNDLLIYAGKTTPPTPPPTPATTALRAQVLVSTLNIRSGPSVTYKNIGSLSKGNILNIINMGGKDLWLEGEAGKWSACVYGGKQYMEIIPGANPADGFTARSLYDHLHIRNGPAITYAEIGQLNTGNTIKVSGIGGKDAWVEFELGKWAAFSYGADKYMSIVK